METIGIIYIVSGVLYTLACYMDGPDLKPKWKKWFGGRLERMANYYYPISYVCEIRYKTRWKIKEVPVPTPIEVTTYELKKIEQCFHLRESDLFEAYMHEEMARNRGVPMYQIPPMMTVDGIVTRAKERCVMSLLESAKNFINIEEDRERLYPEIIIRGILYVGKKR